MKYERNPWTVHNWSATEAERNDPLLPFITLGVLNYNRRDYLRQTLDVMTHAVQYPRYEIILIDNGSTDGSIEMVRSEFPSVIIHEVGGNRGVSARNFLTDLAKGKYLFHFDDDTCPGSPAMVLRIVQHMELYPDIDALSGIYYRPLTGWDETEGWERFRSQFIPGKGFEAHFIVEGGVCFRLDALKKVGGYDPAWQGAEGAELALQFFKQGRKMYLCPWFLTLHFIHPSNRLGRRAYVNASHNIWMIAKHWPLPAAIPLLGLSFIRRIIAIAMHPETARDRTKGIIDGFKGIGPFLRYLPKLTWKQVFGLKRLYISLFRWA